MRIIYTHNRSRTDIEQVREELYSEHSEPDDATLGELLTRFFFFYGFVVQYEGLIVSIRTGKRYEI